MSYISLWDSQKCIPYVAFCQGGYNNNNNNNLRVVVKLPSSLPLCVRLPWPLSAVLVSGPPGFYFAQTLRFSGFHACPRAALEFKGFLAQNRALLRVWRTGVLLTSVFLEWIGPRTPRAQKFAVLQGFLCALYQKHCKRRLKLKIVPSDWSF